MALMESCEFPADPIIVSCTSIEHLASEIRSRKALVVKPMDDPRKLWIGFYAPRTNEWFVLPLTKIKNDSDYLSQMAKIEDRQKFASSLEFKDSWQHESI